MRKKEKHTQLGNLPQSAADFINLVIKKMRYRKKVRAEVQAELTAHFEDELKDCTTDQEKEQKAQQLIADFGDAKLLAVLLRRAKKRCRPLWRTIAARTFQTTGILILCLIAYLLWFLSGKPVVTVDYVAQLNRTVQPAADDSLNAATLYNKAAESYGKPSDDFLLFFAENNKKLVEGPRFYAAGVSLSYLRTLPQKVESGRLTGPINELFSKDKSASFDEDRKLVQGYVATNMHAILSKKYGEATNGEKEFVDRWIQDRKEALDLVIAGTRKPYYWAKYETVVETNHHLLGILLPDLLHFRKLTYCLRWRAWLQAEQAKYHDAFSDIKCVYRLGQHLKEEKTLVEQLVGIAIETLAVETLHSILTEHQIDPRTLAKLQEDFGQLIADENFSPCLIFDKLGMYDGIQTCFTEDLLGSGHLCLEGLRIMAYLTNSSLKQSILEGKNWTVPLHILFTHPDKRQTRQMADRYYEFWEKISTKTPAQLHAQAIDVEKQAAEIIKGNLLLEILAPDIGRVSRQAYTNKTNVEATLTIIATLRYKQGTGDYPTNLDELITAGYLTKPPVDPYSDKPLVYRKTPDNFTLYSAGLNFTDDGGQVHRDGRGRFRRWADEGDAVFWPVPKPMPPKKENKD